MKNLAWNFPTDGKIAALYFSRFKMTFLVRQQKQKKDKRHVGMILKLNIQPKASMQIKLLFPQIFMKAHKSYGNTKKTCQLFRFNPLLWYQ